MRTSDLGRLLMGAASTGGLDLSGFKDVLALPDPDEIAQAITDLIGAQRARISFTIEDLVQALLAYDNVSRISVGTIAWDMRRQRREQSGTREARPHEDDVRNLVGGLQMLAPSAVQIVGDQVVLGSTPERVAEAIRVQASKLPEEIRFELDRLSAKLESST